MATNDEALEASALLATVLAIAPQSSEEAVLRLLVQLGARTVGGDEGSLLVLDEPRAELVFTMVVAARASPGQPRPGQRVPLGAGITGLAAATREVQIGAPTYNLDPNAPPSKGPTAVLAAPMLVGDDVVGVITAVSFADAKRFDARDAETYGQFAAIAGLVVAQRRAIASVSSGVGPAANSALPPLERRVADAVGKLVRLGPGAAEHAARLLEAAVALAEATRMQP